MWPDTILRAAMSFPDWLRLNCMTDDRSTEIPDHPPMPQPDMAALDRLVGSWEVTGGVRGTTAYEWMEGRFFLVQHVDLEHDGRRIKGMEIIGHLQPFGEAPSEDICSRYYGSVGDTLDYVYELEADTLTIWGGEKGSPAYYRGTFNEGGSVCAGARVYPGGGYRSTMTRMT